MDPSRNLGLLPEPLSSVVRGELEPGERLTWVAQPAAGRLARQSLPIVLFAIPWTAFALFWIAGASGFKMPDFRRAFDFFPLFGVPFALLGFAMLAAPLWVVRKARKTVYALTDRRAIVFEGGWSTTIRSYGPAALGALRRKQRRDGSGDLIFENLGTYGGDTPRRATGACGFFGIRDVKQVEELVRQIATNKLEAS